MYAPAGFVNQAQEQSESDEESIEPAIRHKAFSLYGRRPNIVQNTKTMASIFVRLQEIRHIADYDNGISWDPTDALAIVDLVSDALGLWTPIGNEKSFRITCYSLLVRPRD